MLKNLGTTTAAIWKLFTVALADTLDDPETFRRTWRSNIW